MGLINPNLWVRKQTLNVLMSPSSFQHQSGTTNFHTSVWLLSTCFFYHISQRQNSFAQAIWGSLAFMKPVRSLSDDQPMAFQACPIGIFFPLISQEENGCPCLVVSLILGVANHQTSPSFLCLEKWQCVAQGPAANGLSNRLQNWA